MGDSRPKVSVIIPTMNRPKDLERCIRSIASQTLLPDEIVVVDDGDLEPAVFAELLAGLPACFIYEKKDRKGAARSRNVGVRRSSGDVLIFLDDDTELDPDYVRGYLEIFETDPREEIGGLSGAPTRFLNGVELPAATPVGFIGRLERLFLLSSSRGGRVLPSGFRSPMIAPDALTPVDLLQGGNMALRRRVFDEFSFDEELDRLGGYSLGEDVIFSYPIGKKYKLFSTSRARLKHFATPGNRPDKSGLNRMKVIHQYRFVKTTMNGGALNLAAFAWAMVGLVVINTLVVLRRPDRTRWSNLQGVLSGIVHVVRHPGGDVVA
jgi:cellulose synthase/poly-beta-1,6-N-acetylglucosamine synthase-like glycosyltransferase